MNWIQGLLIASIFALVVCLLRSRRSAQSQAWVKVGFVLFVLAGVYAVLRPNDTTVVAHWLGVARGTDLMLYALIIAFSFSTLSTYLRFKDLEVALRATGSRRSRSTARSHPSSGRTARPINRRTTRGLKHIGLVHNTRLSRRPTARFTRTPACDSGFRGRVPGPPGRKITFVKPI